MESATFVKTTDIDQALREEVNLVRDAAKAAPGVAADELPVHKYRSLLQETIDEVDRISPPVPVPSPRRLSRAVDETSLRRPDFAGGTPIRLSNGQEWAFATPTLSGDLYPMLRDDGTVRIVQGFDMGPEYDELTDAYINADGTLEELALLSRIAYILLSRNYDLTFGDMRLLLRIKTVDDPDREASTTMWSAIGDVAFGRSPKPSAGGSGS